MADDDAIEDEFPLLMQLTNGAILDLLEIETVRKLSGEGATEIWTALLVDGTHVRLDQYDVRAIRESFPELAREVVCDRVH